jgi:hypothetical protein
MNDYYDSYKLIAEYLAYLDEALKPESKGGSQSSVVSSQ